jgi:hypothetical protein
MIAGTALGTALFFASSSGLADDPADQPETTHLHLELVFIREPFDVEVTMANGETKSCRLLGLTPTRFIRRDGPNSCEAVVRAELRTIAKIEAPARQTTWTLDAQTKRFTGPTLAPPEHAPIEVRRVAATPERESFYLYASWRWWQRTGYDMAVQANREEQWKSLAQAA